MLVNLKDGIAAHGYDVVSFYNGKPKKGDGAMIFTHNESVYLFSSLENKDKFILSPESYLPQYGGFCAIAMSEDKQLDPNPKSWEIREDKLYFFTRMFFGIIDAKRQWVKDPIVKRQLADAAWEKMKS